MLQLGIENIKKDAERALLNQHVAFMFPVVGQRSSACEKRNRYKGSLWNHKWFFYGIALKNHFRFHKEPSLFCVVTFLFPSSRHVAEHPSEFVQLL